MKIHVFNPEHDIALAANLENFTAPHAARRLFADIGFLPVFWAEDGDCIVVDDVEAAREHVRHIKGLSTNVEFIATARLASGFLASRGLRPDGVEPWGWDAAMRQKLRRWGVADELLPTDSQLADIRRMSSREWVAGNLQPLLTAFATRTLSLPVAATSEEQVSHFLARHIADGSVLKSPWSSSGRGVRYVVAGQSPTAQLWGWIRRVIASQGCIMLEPYYNNKVKDFAMEFRSQADGTVDYLGLSLFRTSNAAYSGSIVASEQEKRAIIERYVAASQLSAVAEEVAGALQQLIGGRYVGPMGVDMMVLSHPDNTFYVHPCIELNLRRTMGHVALSAYRSDIVQQRLLSITYSGSYHLRLHSTAENLINTSLARL